MTSHSLAISIGWIAVSLGIFGTLAQFRRANSLGVEGVSLATWTLFIFMGGFWISYGAVSAHSWEVTLGSLIILPMQLSIVFRLQPWKHWPVVVRSLFFFVVSCVLPTMIWGWADGVYGIGAAMVLTRGPQILELIRYEDASGVSVGSWVLGVVGCACWIYYYSGVHLWAPLVSTFFAGVANLTIAVLAVGRHRQARNALITQEVFVG